MSCNCKNENLEHLENVNVYTDKPVIKKTSFFEYFVKTLTFMLFVIIFPIISVFIFWMVFEMLFLNKSFDIKGLLTMVADKFKNEENNKEPILDELVKVNVEDITNSTSN